jgi:hypothetical protein
MDFDLSVREGPRVLRITVRGQKTVESVTRVWQEIVRESRREVPKPILIEDHMEGSVSPSHYVHLAKMVQELGLSRSFRVATVDLRLKKDYDDDRFGETVAFNRGWNYIRVFRNVSEAETWLLSDVPSAQQS